MKRRVTFLAAVVLLAIPAIVLSIRALRPFVATRLTTGSIPTAPLLTGAPHQEPDPQILLPFVAPATAVPAGTRATPVPEPPEIMTPVATAIGRATDAPHTAAPEGERPSRIRIPSLELDAPVVPIGWVYRSGYPVWNVPDWRAAGWHETSAKLGVAGNTVLNGHNTSNGEVFRDLYKLATGTQIWGDGERGAAYAYRVAEKYILPEAGQLLEVRIANARYIAQTSDERLTLVTCHPYGSLANRLIVIAYRVEQNEAIMGEGE